MSGEHVKKTWKRNKLYVRWVWRKRYLFPYNLLFVLPLIFWTKVVVEFLLGIWVADKFYVVPSKWFTSLTLQLISS
jgi:hypothetical protein